MMISTERIYIKYMVSLRCRMIVKEELRKLGLRHFEIELGSVDVLDEIPLPLREALGSNLLKWGLELLDDKRSILIEKIKTSVVDMVHQREDLPRVNFSDYIAEEMGYDYTYLSNIFSEVTGTTLQQFIIRHRIEKVKELLIYDELTLTEIAHRLQYSSVSHLSSQFKKTTGLTPTFYKSLKDMRRTNLEDV